MSPPSWRRGLKFWRVYITQEEYCVASFLEARIEIGFLHSLQIIISSLIVLLLSSCSCVNIKPRRRQVKTAPVHLDFGFGSISQVASGALFFCF